MGLGREVGTGGWDGRLGREVGTGGWDRMGGEGGPDQVLMALRGVRVLGGGWVVSHCVCHPHGSALPCHPLTYKRWAEGALLQDGMRFLHTSLYGLLHGLLQALLQGLLHSLTLSKTHGLPPMTTCCVASHMLSPVHGWLPVYDMACRKSMTWLTAKPRKASASST